MEAIVISWATITISSLRCINKTQNTRNRTLKVAANDFQRSIQKLAEPSLPHTIP